MAWPYQGGLEEKVQSSSSYRLYRCGNYGLVLPCLQNYSGSAFNSGLELSIPGVLKIVLCSCCSEYKPRVFMHLFLDARSGPNAGVQHAVRPFAHHGAAAGGKPHGQR